MGKRIDEFIAASDKSIEEKISSGLEKLENYKKARTEAIKIDTLKIMSWPYINSGNNVLVTDPKITTIGQLFAYMFPKPEGGEFIQPNTSNGYEIMARDLAELTEEIQKNDDKSISEKYKILKQTYATKGLKNYIAIKKLGGGQYIFDYIMYWIYKLITADSPWNSGYGPSEIGRKLLKSTAQHGDKTRISQFFAKLAKANEKTAIEILEELYWNPSFSDNFEDPREIWYDSDYTIEKFVGEYMYADDNLLYTAILEAGGEYNGKYSDEIDKKIRTETAPKELGGHVRLVIEPDPPTPPDPPVVSPPPTEPPAPGEARAPLKTAGDFTFNVEKPGIFLCADASIGELTIVKPEEQSQFSTVDPIVSPGQEEQLDPEYTEDAYAGEEEQETAFIMPLSDPNPNAESTARVDDSNIDYTNASFVGSQWKSFDIESAVSSINKTDYACAAKFKPSLKKALFYIKNDASMDDLRKAAYLMATAFVEASYSLQRWESDFSCGSYGVKYGTGGPCQKALDYYRSTKGKKDYYTLGTDYKGLPYFGRGLIQLTGKENYKIYGRKIGQDLVGNPDLAIEDQNSYKIAMEYLKSNTFGHVLKGDLTSARKSVNAGKVDLAKSIGAYTAWVNIFGNVA